MEVEVNLSEEEKDSSQWKRVMLLFVRSLKAPGEAQVGKKDWALLVTTDGQLSISKL